MNNDTVGMIVGYLVQLGVPSALFYGATRAINAWRKRRALLAAAPEQKIDTSLARMQQTSIVQDGVIDNLRDAVDVQTRRAESAEERERALLAELAILRNPPPTNRSEQP